MEEFSTLQEALDHCQMTRQFSLALLHKEEFAMDMHIHECYEVYLTITGGQQFLIGDQLYDMKPNDLFCINPFESHYVLFRETEDLERYCVFIHPDYVKKLNTEQTQLDRCFLERPSGYSHRRPLTDPEQRAFLYHVNQLRSIEGYGSDVLSFSRITEFLLFLNKIMENYQEDRTYMEQAGYAPQVRQALAYINLHVHEPLSLSDLAEHLYLSESYLCRIFKASTGTTISKYIIGRRIAIAKTLLSLGYSVAESQTMCGFGDYSNFLKAFTKAVGMSPKKYSQLAHRTGPGTVDL